jgi:hypothetical protein
MSLIVLRSCSFSSVDGLDVVVVVMILVCGGAVVTDGIVVVEVGLDWPWLLGCSLSLLFT